MALPGKHAAVRVMSQTSTPFTDEATTANGDFTVYTIDDRELRYWDRDVPIVVERDAVVVPATEYRIQHAGGRIHFREAQDPGAVITVSGNYYSVVTAIESREFTLTLDRELTDVTVFESDGWRERLAGVGGATGTVSGFFNKNNLFTERLLTQKPLVLELQPDAANDGEIFGLYVVMSSQELAAAVEGAVETSVPWESDGDILVEA